jgi:hypothetical protein
MEVHMSATIAKRKYTWTEIAEPLFGYINVIRDRERELREAGVLAFDRIWPTGELGRVIFGSEGITVATWIGPPTLPARTRAAALEELCSCLRAGEVLISHHRPVNPTVPQTPHLGSGDT